MTGMDVNEAEHSEAQSTNGSPQEPPTPPAQASATGDFAKKQKRVRREGDPTVAEVNAIFLACGRCCYFLAGYRVVCGVEDLEAAVENSKAGWLQLTWNHAMRELVYKSFGSRVDVDFFHYEGSCPECRRHFICESGQDEQPATFRIVIAPRPRR
jgi:hypothetical protein